MHKTKKYLFSLIRIGLAIGLIFYLIKSDSIEWISLSGLLTGWTFVSGAILLFIIATIMQSWRLQILINTHNLNLSFYAAIRLTFIGLFFNTYLPGATGGDLVKIYYASKGNTGYKTEVITIILLDRFIGLFTLLTIPLILSPLFFSIIDAQKTLKGLLWISTIIAITILTIAILGARYDLDNSKILLWAEKKLFFGRELKRILHTIHFYRNSKWKILQIVCISYLVQILMISVSLLLANAVISDGADPKMIILIPLGYLVNTLPVTPGGIGVGEAAMESLFNLFSLQGGAEVILSWRIIMVLVGIIGLVYYLKGEKKFVSSGENNEPS